MGNLARIGIRQGKRVPVEGLVYAPERKLLRQFDRDCLKVLGFDRIADKITEHQDLNFEEICALLEKASFPTLLKLVSLIRDGDRELQIVPLLFAPLDMWARENSPRRVVEQLREQMTKFMQPDLRVVIDARGLASCDPWLFEVLPEIAAEFPEVRFVGPAVQELIVWLSSQDGERKGNRLKAAKLEQMLAVLQAAGFRHLRGSSHRGFLKLVHRAGFPNDHVIRLERFSDTEQLADEFFKLGRLVRDSTLISSWACGVTADARKCKPGVALDLKVISAYAVGMLCLRAVPACRLWSSFISMPALRTIASLGANECVFGAVNDLSAERLRIFPLELVRPTLARVESAKW